MLGMPNEPLPGQRLVAADAAAMIRYHKSAVQRSAPGTYSVSGSGGSTRRPITRRPAYQWPMGGGASTFPYQLADVSDTDSGKVTVRYGTHNSFSPTIYGTSLLPPLGTAVPVLTLDDDAQIVYVEMDFTWDINQNTTISDGIVQQSDSPTAPAITLNFNTDGSGNGSLYQILSGVSVIAPVGVGSYKVTLAQQVVRPQMFYLCGNALIIESD
jgi:hypothetical protein